MTAPTANASPPAQRPRVFWGWWIFGAAIVGQFVTVGFAAQVTGAFLTPMTEDLGWERSQFVLAAAVGFGVGGMSAFFLGPLIDRYGARAIMLIGATLAGCSLLLVSQVTELWQFIAVRGLLAQLGLFMVGPFVVNTTLSKWFVVGRGRVIALASLGASLGGIVPPIVITQVVDRQGWEAGWVVLGIATLVLIYPVALVMRRQPEDFGLLPDGKTGDEEPTEAELRQMEMLRRDFANSYTRGEAVRTKAMWLLIVGFALALAGAGTIFAHSIPFVTDSGFTRSQAAFAFGTQGSVALLSKFFWAWVMQRAQVRLLVLLAMGSMAASAALMVPMTSGPYALVFVPFVLFGFGVGGMIPLSEFVWASYFGRRHIGAVRSTGMPLATGIAVAGPILTGAYFDRSGNYDNAFLGLALALVVGALLVFTSRKPPAKEAIAEAAPAGQPQTAGAPAAAPAGGGGGGA